MGPYGPVCGAAWARRTMPSSSTTSTFLSTAPSDDGAAMSAEGGVDAGQSGKPLRGDNVANSPATRHNKPYFTLFAFRHVYFF